MSILELPLITEKWQEDDIDKRMEHARMIYNQMLSDRLKAYREMTKTRRWRAIENIIKEELQSADGSGKKSERLKAAYSEKSAILKENNFSEFGFSALMKDYYSYYAKTVNSSVAQNTVAKPMWRAFEKMIFGNGQRVHFKKRGELNTLLTDRSGIRFVNEDDKYYVIFSNRKAHARSVKIPVKGPNTMYDKEMLDARIKQCRVLRKMEKGHYHYYVQLVLERPAYLKEKEDGSLIHPIGKGTVGIYIWRTTICAVSLNKILYRDMAPEWEDFEEKRAELSRKLEHLRKVANPDNYNEDGTVKKGIIGEDGKRKKLKWVYTNHYKKVRNELRELSRKEAVKRYLLQNQIVYQLLEMGDHFVMQDTSFLTKKPLWDEETPLSIQEYKKKKERRKAIQTAAPANLVEKLNKKLIAYGVESVEKISITEKDFWYVHEKDHSSRDYFFEDKVWVAGKRILQIPYRAFLIRHYDTNAKRYNASSCSEDFDNFIKAYADM